MFRPKGDEEEIGVGVRRDLRAKTMFRTEYRVLCTVYLSSSGRELTVDLQPPSDLAPFAENMLANRPAVIMKTKELSRAEDLIIEHVEEIRRKWNAVFPA